MHDTHAGLRRSLASVTIRAAGIDAATGASPARPLRQAQADPAPRRLFDTTPGAFRHLPVPSGVRRRTDDTACRAQRGVDGGGRRGAAGPHAAGDLQDRDAARDRILDGGRTAPDHALRGGSQSTVRLSRLRPDRLYQYLIRETGTRGTFRTAPLPPDLAAMRFSASGTLTEELVLVHLFGEDKEASGVRHPR